LYSGISFSDFKFQLNYFIDLYFGDLIVQDLFSFLRNYLEMLFILENFLKDFLFEDYLIGLFSMELFLWDCFFLHFKLGDLW